jgi:hypothetical protein
MQRFPSPFGLMVISNEMFELEVCNFVGDKPQTSVHIIYEIFIVSQITNMATVCVTLRLCLSDSKYTES